MTVQSSVSYSKPQRAGATAADTGDRIERVEVSLVILPLATPLANLLRRAGKVDFATDQLQFLLYGRVVDTARLKDRFGYSPAYTTRAALQDFAVDSPVTASGPTRS